MNTVETVRFMFSMYPHAGTQSDTQIAGYAMLLKDIPDGELTTTVLQCIAESKFVPTVAEIRERWHALTTDVMEGDAEEGWLSVKKAIVGVGSYGTPTFTDPITAKTVQAIGWRELCESDNQAADRAHFLRIYTGFQSRKTEIDRLLPGARAMLEQAAPLKLERMAEVMQIATSKTPASADDDAPARPERSDISGFYKPPANTGSLRR